MSSKSNLQTKVEELLLKYINRFLRYASFSHLPQDRKEILTGTFLYLAEEQDLVPDNVPNIGYLDDLIVFVTAADSFVESQSGQGIPGVIAPAELAEDREFVTKHEGLLFGAHKPSVDALRKKGSRESVDLSALCARIKEKYANLGRMES